MPFPRFIPIFAMAAIAAVSLFATTTVAIVPGDTLTALAAEHSVTVAELVEWNEIDDPDRIVAGDVLFLESPGGGAPEGSGSATAVPDSYVVTAGDTLWLLAQRYGRTVAELANANGLADPNRIVEGATLLLTTGTDGGQQITTDAVEPETGENDAPKQAHTVEAGETLFAISQRHGVRLETIAAANGLHDPDIIREGLVLVIPNADDSSGADDDSPADIAADSEPSDEPAEEPAEETESAVPEAEVAEDRDVETPASSATPVKEAFSRWSLNYGVPQDLLEAIAWKASSWQPSITGPDGELGIGQLAPETVAFVEERLLGLELNPLDVSDGVQLAARYLRYLIDRTHTEHEALAAWHQGLPDLLENGVDAAAGEFADEVLEIRRIRG